MTARNTAIEAVAEAFALPTSEIGDDIALGVTPQWDSLAHMRLMLAIELRIGRKLSAKEIVSITNLGEIVSVVEGSEG